MTDIMDMAAQREAEFLAESLSRWQNRQSVSGSLLHCEDCGELISEARRQAIPGCTRCVICQEYFERGWP